MVLIYDNTYKEWLQQHLANTSFISENQSFAALNLLPARSRINIHCNPNAKHNQYKTTCKIIIIAIVVGLAAILNYHSRLGK